MENLGELTFHQINTSKSDFSISMSSSRYLTNSDFELAPPFSNLCLCNSSKKISNSPTELEIEVSTPVQENWPLLSFEMGFVYSLNKASMYVRTPFSIAAPFSANIFLSAKPRVLNL